MTNKKIFTNGCFDLLHCGHIALFLHCRKLAGFDGKVIVGLDSDQKIARDKGSKRPYFTYEERKQSILSIEYPCFSKFDYKNKDFSMCNLIDTVFCFDSKEELHDLIEIIAPDCIVIGSEWKGNTIGSDLTKVEYFDRILNISTTNIAKRIKEKDYDE